MSYLEYYILSIFCTTLHYFYLFTRQALSQLLFYPLCISFEFIDFILIVGFLHSVKCGNVEMSTKCNSKKDFPGDEALDKVNKHIKDAFDILCETVEI